LTKPPAILRPVFKIKIKRRTQQIDIRARVLEINADSIVFLTPHLSRRTSDPKHSTMMLRDTEKIPVLI